MAWLQADVDALKAAIALGVRRVEYENQSVTYQTRAEMMQTLAAMKAEVSAAAGATKPPPAATRFNTRTGWD